MIIIHDFLNNGAGRSGYHMQNNEARSLSHNISKKLTKWIKYLNITELENS